MGSQMSVIFWCPFRGRCFGRVGCLSEFWCGQGRDLCVWGGKHGQVACAFPVGGAGTLETHLGAGWALAGKGGFIPSGSYERGFPWDRAKAGGLEAVPAEAELVDWRGGWQ